MAMPNQTPVQIAWVTRELDATERTLTELLGVKKWTRMPGVHFGPDSCSYRGQPADFVADISLSYAGDMQLELIAPVSGESIYTEFLDTVGAGLHHICVEVADADAFDAALRDAEARGTPVVQQGVMPGGMRFAYVSAPQAGVPYLEIAHIPSDIRAFFEHIKQEQQ
jgi:catechol 2,3-dioxygenase-like lactoylglutathione lyase family enzyme